MLDEAAQQVVIRGLRDGRREAWTALYDGYSTDVWRYVARLVGDDLHAVGDVVQETFLSAARSARGIDTDRGTLWSWLTGIAHHQVLAHWRGTAQSARWKVLAAAGAIERRQGISIDPIQEGSDQRERMDLVRRVLSDLPPDYAQLLIGKYLDELSLEQLSRLTGSSIEATKSKLARARQEFRTRFERLPDGKGF